MPRITNQHASARESNVQIWLHLLPGGPVCRTVITHSDESGVAIWCDSKRKSAHVIKRSSHLPISDGEEAEVRGGATGANAAAACTASQAHGAVQACRIRGCIERAEADALRGVRDHAGSAPSNRCN